MSTFTFLVIVSLSGLAIWVIVDNILCLKGEKEVDEYLAEINYKSIVEQNLLELFGDERFHVNLMQSREVVGNFKKARTFDYLIKYFHLVIDDESLMHISNIYIVEKKAEDFVIGSRYREKVLANYIPKFAMIYESPMGKSYLKSEFIFNTNGLKGLYKKVKWILSKQNHAKTQRSAMTQQMREAIFRRDNWTCQICGNSVYKEPNLLLEVDHIVPISKGGKTEPNNLQTLCWRCNRSKSDKIYVPKKMSFPDDSFLENDREL